MRQSPAYQALKQSSKKTEFTFTVEEKKDLQDNHYCLIALAKSEQKLTIGGEIYQSEGAAHLSFYEYYKEKKSHLSVFHYTWYGCRNDTHIVVHAYFNCVGKYLYCVCKDQKTKEKIKILENEEGSVRQLYYQQGSTISHSILQYVRSQYFSAETKVKEALNQLEKLSLHIQTQKPKYITLAEDCIKIIMEKDRWTFGDDDPKGSFLKKVIIQLKKGKNMPDPLITSGTFKYNDLHASSPNQSSHSSENNHPSSEKNKNKKIKITLSQELKNQLDFIDQKIKKLENVSIEKKVSETLVLLKKKLAFLLDSNEPVPENILIKVLNECNQQQKNIDQYFSECVNKEKNSLFLLVPYLTCVTSKHLRLIIENGNIEVFKSCIEYHPEHVFFFINHTYIGLRSNQSVSNQFDSIQGFLVYIMLTHDGNLALFEMALKNGADPNLGTNVHESVLYLSIEEGLFEHAKLLLQYGADPNPPLGKRSHSIGESKNNVPAVQTIKQVQKNAMRGKIDSQTENHGVPLHAAIFQQNPAMVELLLQYGASLTQKAEGCDAIGVATCGKTKLPHPEIVKILVQYGANINSVQCQGEKSEATALFFACQRGDIDTVGLVLELGTDLNQALKAQVNLFGQEGVISLTSLHMAVLKNNFAIVSLLVSKEHKFSFENIALGIVLIIAGDRLESMVCNMSLDEKEANIKINFDSNQSEKKEVLNLLSQYMFLNFDEQQIKDHSLSMIEQGKFFYQAKNYPAACLYFMSGMLFGDCKQQKQLQSCSYNFSCCLYAMKQYECAACFFDIVTKFLPENDINIAARKMCEKIQQINSNKMKLIN